MPSMQFFMEDKKSGRIHRAFERLMKNLLLLIHILMIIGIAAALADFYLPGHTQPDKAVIVFDRSASMSDDIEEAKRFVKSNLGNKNTLIVVDEDVKVPLERASSSRVKKYLKSLETQDVETDIAGGLELAQDYKGELIVASDLDQTISQRSAADIIKQLRSNGRSVKTMDTSNSNSWGIVRVDPGRTNSSVDIKNFETEKHSVKVEVNGNSRSVSIEPEAVETVTFSTSKQNRIRLEPDGLAADNTAYVSIPGEKKFEVMLVSDSGKPYFEKAVELIGFTRIESVRPPAEQKLDADVYVVGKTDGILKDTVNRIEKEVQDGASLVVFAQDGLNQLDFSSVPALGSPKNRTVEVLEPRRISIGSTRVYKLDNTPGESLSRPESAIIKTSYGRGEVLLYNVRDEDFRYDFMYPIFWKNMLADLTDRPSIEELNLETGESINKSNIQTPGGETKEGFTTLIDSGFYNTSRGVYAANLISEDESKTETPELGTEARSTSDSNKSLETLLALLLAGLAAVELVYLRSTGDI